MATRKVVDTPIFVTDKVEQTALVNAGAVYSVVFVVAAGFD
jgi:hypothetical protein